MESAHLTIESIARGTMKPGRIILWLDDRDVDDDLSASLMRLKRRGLEVRSSENFGPHTKYYPYVESLPMHVIPLVTADDDILYPRTWLSRLDQEHRNTPDEVVAYRARRIGFNSMGFAPYDQWPFVSTDKPSFLNFATGVGGVIYPPALLNTLRERGRDFLPETSANDDIWLHHTAFRAGFPVRQVDRAEAKFPLIDSTQSSGLKHSNVAGGANDQQLSTVYSPDDVDLLRRLSETPD